MAAPALRRASRNAALPPGSSRPSTAGAPSTRLGPWGSSRPGSSRLRSSRPPRGDRPERELVDRRVAGEEVVLEAGALEGSAMARGSDLLAAWGARLVEVGEG
jgi:hypothetical protein